MASTPCSSCPWRRDAPRQHWHPEEFQKIWTGCQDDGTHVMLCHKAARLPEDQRKNIPCRGWLIVIGTDAIGVRLLLARGAITGADLNRSKKCPKLFGTFAGMVRAQGIEPPKRNKFFDHDAEK